jgi:chromosome segregation ATPase
MGTRVRIDVDGNVGVLTKEPSVEVKPPEPTGDELRDQAAQAEFALNEARSAAVELRTEANSQRSSLQHYQQELESTKDASRVPELAGRIEKARKRLAILEPSIAAAERHEGECHEAFRRIRLVIGSRQLEAVNRERLVRYQTLVAEWHSTIEHLETLAIQVAEAASTLAGDAASAQQMGTQGILCSASGATPNIERELLPQMIDAASWQPPLDLRRRVALILGRIQA